MDNVVIQLVKKKSLIENDINMDNQTSKILAYAMLITECNGVKLYIKDISIRQDVKNPAEIKVVFPYRKIYNELIYSITFDSEEHKNKICADILVALKQSMQKEMDRNG